MIFTLPLADHIAYFREMLALNTRFALGNEEQPFKIQGTWRMPLKEVCANFGIFVRRNAPLLEQKTSYPFVELIHR
jgi:hypothetical protein